jgi:hypothetical protein
MYLAQDSDQWRALVNTWEFISPTERILASQGGVCAMDLVIHTSGCNPYSPPNTLNLIIS